MGCTFGKFSSPPRKRETTKRLTRNVNRVPSHNAATNNVGVVLNTRVHDPHSSQNARNNVLIVREEDKTEEKKKIARIDFVGEWPKWLVDNIPTDVLATLIPKSADSFEKLAKIGRGTYSNVYKARDKSTGKIVALKKVRFDTTDSESIKFMAREIMILQTLDHPNVIKLEGLATSRMQYNSLYLVFDFMQSDLTRIISRPGERLTEPQVKCFMQQLLCGLQHCHERGVMHRDIKASNLLVDKKGVLKIADFGLANSFATKSEGPLTNRVVTLWYRAPELLLGSTNYDYGIDLWSAGCLLAEMFVGKPIIPGRNEVEQMHMIFKLFGSPPENYWQKLKLTTTYRPPQHYKASYRENFQNFPPSTYDLLATLLDLDPANRGTASSALHSEFFKSSPLACDPSALPVIYKDEEERLQTKRRRRKKALKRRQLLQTSVSDVSESRRIGTDEKTQPRYSELSKKEKNLEEHKEGPEAGNSASSTSSGASRSLLSTSMNASISPPFLPFRRKSPNTDGHPSALKNIKIYNSLLQASRIDMTKRNEVNEFTQIRRSFSTSDFRVDPDKQV